MCDPSMMADLPRRSQPSGLGLRVRYMVFAGAAWSVARSLFEEYILGGPIGFPSGLGRFALFACGLHLAIALAVALLAGVLGR
jgi:hypothetical protein